MSENNKIAVLCKDMLIHPCTDSEGAVFAWTSPCQDAFDRLKTLLAEAHILVHPDFDKNFTLETDASAQGLGAVLSQMQDDKRCTLSLMPAKHYHHKRRSM